MWRSQTRCSTIRRCGVFWTHRLTADRRNRRRLAGDKTYKFGNACVDGVRADASRVSLSLATGIQFNRLRTKDAVTSYTQVHGQVASRREVGTQSGIKRTGLVNRKFLSRSSIGTDRKANTTTCGGGLELL